MFFFSPFCLFSFFLLVIISSLNSSSALLFITSLHFPFLFPSSFLILSSPSRPLFHFAPSVLSNRRQQHGDSWGYLTRWPHRWIVCADTLRRRTSWHPFHLRTSSTWASPRAKGCTWSGPFTTLTISSKSLLFLFSFSAPFPFLFVCRFSVPAFRVSPC